MSAEAPVIHSIVVTHNGEEWIRDCLESLQSASTKTEIVVIDNNSSDNTADIVKHACPDVRIIELDENVGFGRGSNVGMKNALDNGADYVFLLNQDAKIEKCAIDGLFEASRENRGYGIISPLQCNWDGSSLDFRFSTYLDPVRCPSLYSDSLLGRPLHTLYEVEFVNAAAWLIPIEIVEEVGGFDPMFFHYGEDENYVQRVRYIGKKVGVCPHVRIYHDREGRHSMPQRTEGAEQRRLMVRYGDVNSRGPELLRERKKVLKRRYVRQCLTGFRGVREIRNEIKLLRNATQKINDSWAANKESGPKYL